MRGELGLALADVEGPQQELATRLRSAEDYLRKLSRSEEAVVLLDGTLADHCVSLGLTREDAPEVVRALHGKVMVARGTGEGHITRKSYPSTELGMYRLVESGVNVTCPECGRVHSSEMGMELVPVWEEQYMAMVRVRPRYCHSCGDARISYTQPTGATGVAGPTS